MLYILTGNIQTGKTRWLCDAIGRLGQKGVMAVGVVAPGIWRPATGVRKAEGGSQVEGGCGSLPVGISGGFTCSQVEELDWSKVPAAAPDANGYEKLGICNVALPSSESVLFAVRQDVVDALKLAAVPHDAQRRMWHFFDDAIDRMNAVLGELRQAQQVETSKRELLVIDELGWMELQKDGGLTNAVALLNDGPSKTRPHALVVVRSDLAPLAIDRFADRWQGTTSIYPTTDDLQKLLAAFNCE